MLTAAECATRTGLTVRALRLYERQGLISPYRTQKNWRLYGAKDIERLNEIIILKGFGLPLARIARLLAGKETNLADVLAMQADALSRQRSRIERSLATIASLQSEMSSGAASVSTLINFATEMTMTQSASDEIAWKMYEQARPRAETTLEPESLKDYKGSYRLGGNSILSIVPGENAIEVSLKGQHPVTMYPEARDKFFCKNIPAQIAFDRDAEGKVCGLTIHQSGHEQVARRISESEAAAFTNALSKRISDKIAFAGSEKMIRKMISDAQAGFVDKAAMTAKMAAIAQDQARTIQGEMNKLGSLHSLTFKGVGQDGWDVYDATFENGHQQWRLNLQEDGKVSGLFVMPSP